MRVLLEFRSYSRTGLFRRFAVCLKFLSISINYVCENIHTSTSNVRSVTFLANLKYVLTTVSMEDPLTSVGYKMGIFWDLKRELRTAAMLLICNHQIVHEEGCPNMHYVSIGLQFKIRKIFLASLECMRPWQAYFWWASEFLTLMAHRLTAPLNCKNL